GRPRRDDGRRSGRERRPPFGAAGVRGRGRRAVRLLHPWPRGRNCGPPAAQPSALGRRDPRGALREPVPLYGLREDLRRRAGGGGAGMTQAVRTLQVGKVGELVPRLDAPPKVKGEFAYASDLIVPGMLWG